MSIIFCSMDIKPHWCKFLQQQPSSRTQVSVALTFFWLSFQMTFLGKPFGGIWWHSSTKFVLTGPSIPCKISSTFISMFLSPTSTGILDILWHSLLEYFWLAWNFRSRTTSLSESLLFAFLRMCRSDPRLQILVFNSFRSFFGSLKCCWIFLGSLVISLSNLLCLNA